LPGFIEIGQRRGTGKEAGCRRGRVCISIGTAALIIGFTEATAAGFYQTNVSCGSDVSPQDLEHQHRDVVRSDPDASV
jgi:hypothetical protein